MAKVPVKVWLGLIVLSHLLMASLPNHGEAIWSNLFVLALTLIVSPFYLIVADSKERVIGPLEI